MIKLDQLDFLCGQMLGRLAKWLKLLGYPTLIAPIKLDKLSEKKPNWKDFSKIILTRSQDPRLPKMYPNASIKTIKSNEIDQQLKQLYQEDIIDFKHDTRPYYCTACSSVQPLVTIDDKEKFKDKIPSQSYKHYKQFYQCINCEQIFWKGTHWQDIEKKLQKIKTQVENADSK